MTCRHGQWVERGLTMGGRVGPGGGGKREKNSDSCNRINNLKNVVLNHESSSKVQILKFSKILNRKNV